MEQRGITVQEIETTINEGWNASDTKAGTTGKVFVFPFNAYWEQKYFEEKEVTVYYKEKDKVVLLTVKARYAACSIAARTSAPGSSISSNTTLDGTETLASAWPASSAIGARKSVR